MARFGRINKRDSTIVVAASDSQEKAGADYVCPATAAIAYINSTVIPSLPAGGRVLFLEGNYEMTTTAEAISLTSSQNGCSFAGQGYGTNFYSKNSIGAIDHFFTANNADGITIENMRFTSGTGNSGDNIHPEGGSDYWMIRNNYFVGNWTYGLYFVNGSKATVVGNNFYNSATTGNFIISDQTTNSVIANNVFSGSATPIYLYNATSAYNTIIGNTFTGCGSAAIAFASAIDCIISGNTLYNVGAGIVIVGTDCLVTGNLIKTSSGGGITVASYNDVIGNRIEGTVGHGISLSTGTSNHVEGNKVRGYDTGGSGTYDGINVASAAGTTILSNSVTRLYASAYGINIASGTGAVVRGNYIANTATTDIYDAGTNTIYYDLITDVFSDIIDEDTDYVVDNYSLNAAPPITCTISNQPDVPRNVTYTVTDAAGGDLAFSFTVTGVDMNGRTVTETFTGTGTTSGTGVRGYQSITSVICTVNTNYGAGDVIDVGVGATFGLSGQITKIGDVVQAKKNGVVITGGGADYTTNATYNTVALTAVAANDDLTVLFRKCANTLTWT